MKYRGRMIIELDHDDPSMPDGVVELLQQALDRVRPQFEQVLAAHAERDGERRIVIRLELESSKEYDLNGEVDELDDIADRFIDRALESVNDDDSDDVTVIESALMPA